MPAIDIGALFIGREDWEGNDGSGVATEDEDDTDAEVGGGYERDFLEVVLRQLWEGRFGRMMMAMKMTETSRDNKHEEDVMTWSMYEMLCECEGKPSLSSSTACPKRRSSATAARAGGTDPSRTRGARTTAMT